MEHYDIEKLAESNNRERKISQDFDDDDDLGMDFFKTMEEIYSQINKNEQNNENCEKNEEKLWFLHWNKIFRGGPPPPK